MNYPQYTQAVAAFGAGPQYTQAVAGLGDAFPGSAGPFVTPGTSPYQKSGSAASLASFGIDSPDNVKNEPAVSYVKLGAALASSAAGLAGAYHGYKRNDSIGWAIGWSLLASAFWPIAVPIMIAQGFGKPASKAAKKNPRKAAKKSLRRRS